MFLSLLSIAGRNAARPKSSDWWAGNVKRGYLLRQVKGQADAPAIHSFGAALQKSRHLLVKLCLYAPPAYNVLHEKQARHGRQHQFGSRMVCPFVIEWIGSFIKADDAYDECDINKTAGGGLCNRTSSKTGWCAGLPFDRSPIAGRIVSRGRNNNNYRDSYCKRRLPLQ